MEEEADQAARDENKKKGPKPLTGAASYAYSSLSLSVSLAVFLSTDESSSDFGSAWAVFQDGTVTLWNQGSG